MLDYPYKSLRARGLTILHTPTESFENNICTFLVSSLNEDKYRHSFGR